MKTTITGQLQHLAADELLDMVSPDTLARIKQTDQHPEFRAYVVGHEGEAQGRIIGLGLRAVQYFRDAIVAIHNQLRIGTGIFHRHKATNDRTGDTAIGELVGKRLASIGGMLHNIAAVYVYPQHRELPLDVASIEAEVQLTDNGGGRMSAVNVGDITGIALSNSAVEKPGFPGATLLAAVQAFVGEGKEPMTLEELKKAIAEGKHKPSELFDADALKSDPVVSEHIKAEKQTEYEHAKRIERKLEAERADWTKKTAEHEAAVKKLSSEALQSRSRDTLTQLVTDRKLDDKQKAFVERNFGSFKSEAADTDGLKADLNKYLDTQVKEYEDVSKLLGVTQEKKEGQQGGGNDGGGKNVPSGDGAGGGTALTDPKQNDFIPQ